MNRLNGIEFQIDTCGIEKIRSDMQCEDVAIRTIEFVQVRSLATIECRISFSRYHEQAKVTIEIKNFLHCGNTDSDNFGNLRDGDFILPPHVVDDESSVVMLD